VRGTLLEELQQVYAGYAIYCPSEFGRHPRRFSDNVLKATELRLWILYLAPVLLIARVQTDLVECILYLFVALRLLSDPATAYNDEDRLFAHECLVKFVDTSAFLFRREFVVYCVHNLLHLVEEVRLHGPLDVFSAFIAENEFRHMMRLVHTPKKPLIQLLVGLQKKRAYEQKFNPGGGRQRHEGQAEFELKQERGPQREDDNDDDGSRWFDVYSAQHIRLDCRSMRDAYCEVREDDGDTVSLIQCYDFVVKPNGDCVVKGARLDIDDDTEFFVYPCKASRLGIYLVKGTCRRVREWSLYKIERKLFKVPVCPSFGAAGPRDVVIPLLHTALTKN
jgi:hypothetical protein